MKKQVNFTFFEGTEAAFTMIAVKGGTFKMGSNECADEKPIHTVKLGDFWMGQYLVTQAVWKKVMNGVNPSYFKGDTCPVEQVSWETIIHDFLPKLNALTENKRPDGTLFYLPTEAQWEYAARGGEHEKKYSYKYSGSDKLDEVGWYSENLPPHPNTKPVGLKLPNLLGIYDMSGNVDEWCSDICIYYKDVVDRDLQGVRRDVEKGARRVTRGGRGCYDTFLCQVSRRSDYPRTYGSPGVGFRLCLFD